MSSRTGALRRHSHCAAPRIKIAAILGHRSLAKVMRYTKSVEQKKMELEAMAKFEKVSNAKNNSV
ncbi:hypothetical protein AA0312_2617 [Acetobacter tropicalis NRIC 0312]|uniref:Uncharacterized protein n=1 Tax=Acetobacter tropicalis TaxID=104102 RepID=A0A511FNN0_9PROT|nr:hypothetical protein ATR1_039c0083 [Acetobacter tropicalis]GBR71967.1 hypothetical protein AA0312_2617 [Acetobacter tropicalis NRIC 0312]GEL50519.1 hypothetical protein ATR01nite_15940 [Acetobacter tropicalis]